MIESIGNSGYVSPVSVTMARADGASHKPEVSFRDVLMKQIEQVDRLQQDADKAIESLAAGRRDTMAGVMLAKHRADAAFEALIDVRQQLQEAYAQSLQ